ncbi:hypothetical protein ACE14D_21665, partial [Streptomyces sp. Act-28]
MALFRRGRAFDLYGSNTHSPNAATARAPPHKRARRTRRGARPAAARGVPEHPRRRNRHSDEYSGYDPGMNAADLGLPVAVPSTALFTDHYELTMLQAALRGGTAERRSVFEVFTRRLPEGRRYGVVAGTGRVLDAVENFRFDDAMLAFLRERGVVDEPTLAWLAEYRFVGDVWGYPEGEVYFPGSPILRVEGSFAECVLLETVILSILNHDSAIAAAASRMSAAAAAGGGGGVGRRPPPRPGAVLSRGGAPRGRGEGGCG